MIDLVLSFSTTDRLFMVLVNNSVQPHATPASSSISACCDRFPLELKMKGPLEGGTVTVQTLDGGKQKKANDLV